MRYIDVVVNTHDTDPDALQITWPSDIAAALEKAGYTVRSAVVVDGSSGLTGVIRNDKVQGKINKELGK